MFLIYYYLEYTKKILAMLFIKTKTARAFYIEDVIDKLSKIKLQKHILTIILFLFVYQFS